MKKSVYTVWNQEDVKNYLTKFVDDNFVGADALRAHLLTALFKPLTRDDQYQQEIKTRPANAPKWLREKWSEGGPWYQFFPDKNLDDKLRHVTDWIKAALVSKEAWLEKTDDQGRPIKLLKIGSVEQAINIADRDMQRAAQKLQQQIALGGLEDSVDQKVVKTFEDGFAIVRLLTPEALDYETAQLGHCIGNGAYDDNVLSGKSVFYALRDPKNRSHATLEVNRDGDLLQCKGKRNAPPVYKYFPYIKSFVEEKQFYLSESCSHTGLVRFDGEYHAISRLPEGTSVYETLDLSNVQENIILPKGLKVEGSLILPGNNLPALPDDINVTGNLIEKWKKKEKLHRIGGPARREICPHTQQLISEQWYEHGKELDKRVHAIFRRNKYYPVNRLPGGITLDDTLDLSFETSEIKLPKRLKIKGDLIYSGDNKPDIPEGIVVEGNSSQLQGCFVEVYRRNNLLHRDDGPAYIKRDSEGRVIEERWYRNGRLHREDGASLITYMLNGHVDSEHWYRNGERHRIGGPALVERECSKEMRRESWYYNGQLHREDGPALVIKDWEGKDEQIMWYIHGKLHRDGDEPALMQVVQRRSGCFNLILFEQYTWYKNGKKCRDGDLPAQVTKKREGGEICDVIWFKRGEQVSYLSKAFMDAVCATDSCYVPAMISKIQEWACHKDYAGDMDKNALKGVYNIAVKYPEQQGVICEILKASLNQAVQSDAWDKVSSIGRYLQKLG